MRTIRQELLIFWFFSGVLAVYFALATPSVCKAGSIACEGTSLRQCFAKIGQAFSVAVEIDPRYWDLVVNAATMAANPVSAVEDVCSSIDGMAVVVEKDAASRRLRVVVISYAGTLPNAARDASGRQEQQHPVQLPPVANGEGGAFLEIQTLIDKALKEYKPPSLDDPIGPPEDNPKGITYRQLQQLQEQASSHRNSQEIAEPDLPEDRQITVQELQAKEKSAVKLSENEIIDQDGNIIVIDKRPPPPLEEP